MKSTSYAAFAVALSCAPLVAAEFTVHEWGTFTSVVGSDGRMLTGLEVEEEAVPPFVHSLTGFAPSNKGWDRPVRNVTVKMETPVLYFYSKTPLSVRVDVRFNGGSISQWYPDRVAGETMPEPRPGNTGVSLGSDTFPPIDFTSAYKGRASWRVDILASDATTRVNTPREQETPQWPRARVPGANLVRGVRGEVEGFVFYRGIGNFSMPLEATVSADGPVRLRNTGVEPLPFVWVYEKPRRAGESARSWCGSLPVAASQVVTATAVIAEPEQQFHRALVAAGLTSDEAAALRSTWRESYFDRAGLRVFWIVPRKLADAVLPIAIEPRPSRLERVLVGRTEVLTPAFETELARDFAMNGGRRWETDRYYRAYRDRVQQHGLTVGVAARRRTP
jgi:hypothetical protein